MSRRVIKNNESQSIIKSGINAVYSMNLLYAEQQVLIAVYSTVILGRIYQSSKTWKIQKIRKKMIDRLTEKQSGRIYIFFQDLKVLEDFATSSKTWKICIASPESSEAS